MSTPYEKGVRWEREVRRILTLHGWRVIRATGSKPIDLVAFRPGRVPLVIECKFNRSPSKAMVGAMRQLGLSCGFRYLVVSRKNKRRKH